MGWSVLNLKKGHAIVMRGRRKRKVVRRIAKQLDIPTNAKPN